MNRFASNFILATTFFVVGSVAGYLLFMLATVLLIIVMWTRLFRLDQLEKLFSVFNKQSGLVFSLGFGVAVTIWMLYKKHRLSKKTQLDQA